MDKILRFTNTFVIIIVINIMIIMIVRPNSRPHDQKHVAKVFLICIAVAYLI